MVVNKNKPRLVKLIFIFGQVEPLEFCNFSPSFKDAGRIILKTTDRMSPIYYRKYILYDYLFYRVLNSPNKKKITSNFIKN